MFPVKDQSHKEKHFANAAKRFALDAKMMRCKAAVHVEDKDDIIFWGRMFKHFRPDDRFHFIAGSRNENGRETSGVTQCLKYIKYLSRDFFICIDSDYRYLMKERKINIKHYVFQTYTYSFENHHCFAEGLDGVCSRVTHLKNNVFNFQRFLTEYSHIIYDLFIWHLYFLNADPLRFSKYEFNKYINIFACKPRVTFVHDNGARMLDELRIKVEGKIEYFGRKYPNADLDIVKERYEKLGFTPDTAYFFVRGHNLYDMTTCMVREVCKAMLRLERGGKDAAGDVISEIYRNRNNLEEQLQLNIKYGAYLLIQKIEEDMKMFFGE